MLCADLCLWKCGFGLTITRPLPPTPHLIGWMRVLLLSVIVETLFRGVWAVVDGSPYAAAWSNLCGRARLWLDASLRGVRHESCYFLGSTQMSIFL